MCGPFPGAGIAIRAAKAGRPGSFAEWRRPSPVIPRFGLWYGAWPRSRTAMPLSLNDDEYNAVQAAAAPIHPLQRDAFLKALAVELERHPVVGPGLVHRVAAELQKTFGVVAHSETLLAPRRGRARWGAEPGPGSPSPPAGVRSCWSLWLCAMLASIDNNRGEET